MASSYDDTWDDSALIDSWNEALEEYKHYHSLHARGEKVEDVLRELDEANLKQNGTAKTPSMVNGFKSDGIVAAQDVDVTNDEIDDGENQMEEGIAFAAVNQPLRGLGESGINPDGGAIPPLASFPDALLGPDEMLKNLMMSWYYAGYYTGLYEGQHQAQQASGAQQTAQTGSEVRM